MCCRISATLRRQRYKRWKVFSMMLEVRMKLIVRKFWFAHRNHKQFYFLRTDATSGSSRDHAYGKHNIPVSYTIEQRGNGGAIYGNHGFFLPPQYIIPNCLEIVAGLKAMVGAAREHGLLAAPTPAKWLKCLKCQKTCIFFHYFITFLNRLDNERYHEKQNFYYLNT